MIGISFSDDSCEILIKWFQLSWDNSTSVEESKFIEFTVANKCPAA